MHIQPAYEDFFILSLVASWWRNLNGIRSFPFKLLMGWSLYFWQSNLFLIFQWKLSLFFVAVASAKINVSGIYCRLSWFFKITFGTLKRLLSKDEKTNTPLFNTASVLIFSCSKLHVLHLKQLCTHWMSGDLHLSLFAGWIFSRGAPYLFLWWKSYHRTDCLHPRTSP